MLLPMKYLRILINSGGDSGKTVLTNRYKIPIFLLIIIFQPYFQVQLMHVFLLFHLICYKPHIYDFQIFVVGAVTSALTHDRKCTEPTTFVVRGEFSSERVLRVRVQV